MITKYTLLRKILVAYLCMAGLSIIPAFLICCLSWGSYGWMGSLDLKKLTYEEARSHFIDMQLDRDVNMYISGKPSVIEAGTRFKVMGYFQTLPEREGIAGWLVQTEDNRRGGCNIRDLNEVNKDSVLLVYDHNRRQDLFKFHTIAYQDDINELISKGVSFEEFDSKYGPTIDGCVNPETGKYVAKYEGTDYSFDDRIWHCLEVTFSDDHLESARARGTNDSWVLNIFAPLANNWMKHSAAYISPGYYMPVKGYDPLQSSFYPYKWVARGVMGVVDVWFAFLVAAIASAIAILLFAEDKSKHNSYLEKIIFFTCAIAYTLYCYYTMEFSANLFCFGLATIIAIVVGCLLENRCEECHSLVEMEVIDKEYGEVKTKVSEFHDSKDRVLKRKKLKDTHDEKIERSLVDTDYYTHRWVEKHQEVTITYRCPECGHTFKSTHDNLISSAYNKYFTGTDHKTITTTTKYRYY